MDPFRITTVKQEILTAIGRRIKCIASTQDHSETGWVLKVGLDQANVKVRSVFDRSKNPTGKYVLCVKTENTKVKTYRETRTGQFMIGHIVKHILECFAIEQKLRQEALRKRQLSQSAENAIKRLAPRVPSERVVLSSNQNFAGTLDIQIYKVTEDIVSKVLDVLQGVKWDSKDEGAERGLWDHLQEEEF